MLELVELEFKCIGRFVEMQKISFCNLGSFVQVDGQNNNTGGSSGSGKSTVFAALDYLLGLDCKPATILQSRKIVNPDENPIWVRGKFLFKGDTVTITRTKGSTVLVSMDGIFQSSKAEEKIDALLGMSRDLFRKVIHKRQGEGGFFLALTPGEMYEFLMDCCNLSRFKKHMVTVDAKIKDYDTKISSFENDLKVHQQGLSATQDAILSLGLAPVQDIHREVILGLKETYDRSALRLRDVQDRCQESDRQYVQGRPSTTNGQYDTSAREGFERRGKEIEQEISEILKLEQKRQGDVKGQISEKIQQRSQAVARVDQGNSAKTNAAKIAAQIKSIRAKTCPTCAQGWETESALATEKKLLDDLVLLKELIKGGTFAEGEVADMDIEISALKGTLSPITSPELPTLNEELRAVTQQILDDKRKANELYDQQNAETKAKLDAFMTGQAELRKKNDIEIEQARGQADVDRRVLDIAVQKLRAYDEARSRYDKTYKELKEKEEKFQNLLIKCKSDLETTTDCMERALETKKAIKMYVSFSFDQALDAIGDKATKIIRCIPNTSGATIQFEGTRETGKGVVKEEVTAVISSDGEIGVPIKSLSGGERSSTDLAVDLAVIDYIESKTGKGLNIFILDEPFTGLGTVEIEMALEVLKNSNINKKLTIVDHNPEVKQMVQDRLVVVRDGLTSKVA